WCPTVRRTRNRRFPWIQSAGSRPCRPNSRWAMAERDATPQQLFDRFRRWLKERRLPVTRPRDLVARAVFEGGEHLSVDGIQRRLRDRGEKVGTGTIYRSLDILLESGLVRAHDFGEGFQRFEPITTTGEHGHLICSRCGRVTEFSTERVERVLQIIADE